MLLQQDKSDAHICGVNGSGENEKHLISFLERRKKERLGNGILAQGQPRWSDMIQEMLGNVRFDQIPKVITYDRRWGSLETDLVGKKFVLVRFSSQHQVSGVIIMEKGLFWSYSYDDSSPWTRASRPMFREHTNRSGLWSRILNHHEPGGKESKEGSRSHSLLQLHVLGNAKNLPLNPTT